MTPRERFLKLLREDVLQVDLADLDFGIYRILNHRRAKIDAFLTEQLPARIDVELARLPGTAGEDEQARIYNELYTFFNRYYEDGDFVPRARRGRDAAYSVAWDGRDVFFHWATRGSHYVKSGERFAGYAYRQADGRRIALNVRRADTEKDNVKGERRYYVPAAFEHDGGQSRLLFDYRKLDAKEARRYERKGAAPADETGDEDGADAPAAEGRSAQERLLNAWRDGTDFKTVAPAAGIDRALLARHAQRCVKGQTTDFFVHPKLGEFLRGELDYHLKNEFVRIWHLPDGEALARERGKFAIVQRLAEAIVDVLAAIEDVQAVLFEKRKFVLAADWLVRASALAALPGGAALVAQAAANEKQVTEWARWVGVQPRTAASAPPPQPSPATQGREFPPPPLAGEGRGGGDGAADGADGRALLQRYPHLPIHTAHFDADFKAAVLACFDDLDAATGGLLIHAENYAALRTIEPAYRQGVKCIYIDPPYNTAASEIAYKNGMKSASWLALLDGRVSAAKRLLRLDGAFVAAIDDFEAKNLGFLMDETFDDDAHWATVPVRSKPQGRATANGFSINHEYLLFYGCSPASSVGRLPREGTRADRYPESDSVGAFAWANLRKTGSDSRQADRPGQYFPIYVGESGARVPDMSWDDDTEEWIPAAPQKGEVAVFPVDDSGERRVWSVAPERAREDLRSSEIQLRREGQRTYFVRKYRPNEEGALPHTWWSDAKYSASESGTKVLRDVMGGRLAFSFPKSLFAVADSLRVLGIGASNTALDFFAGSGTTAHAVLNLNREDGGERKFVLVEQGEYFDTVLLPRVAKVMACPEWKDGKPKPGVAMQAAAGEDAAAHWSARTPALVKVLRLERYEDSLDALELPAEKEARAAGQLTLAAGAELIRYLADATAAGNTVRLATEKLAAPFAYRLPYTHEGVRGEATIDLPETAQLLLGLHALRQRRLTTPAGGPALLVEARPHKPGGAAAGARVLVFWRDVDDNLAPAALARAAEAERDWLSGAVREHFGRELADYATVYYNRDLLLPPDASGQSLDSLLAKAMMERA